MKKIKAKRLLILLFTLFNLQGCGLIDTSKSQFERNLEGAWDLKGLMDIGDPCCVVTFEGRAGFSSDRKFGLNFDVNFIISHLGNYGTATFSHIIQGSYEKAEFNSVRVIPDKTHSCQVTLKNVTGDLNRISLDKFFNIICSNGVLNDVGVPTFLDGDNMIVEKNKIQIESLNLSTLGKTTFVLKRINKFFLKQKFYK